MQIIFAAEILVIRLDKKYNPASEIYLDEFQAWIDGIPDRQTIYKANRQQNHTASGIVSNKKVMKVARD